MISRFRGSWQLLGCLCIVIIPLMVLNVLAFNGENDREAADLRDTYHQIVATSPAVAVRFEMKVGVTKSYGKRNAEKLAELEKIFAEMSVPDQKKNRAEYEYERKRYRAFATAATKEPPTSRIEIVKDTGAVEVRVELGLKKEPRRDSAKEKGLKSFTGGDYIKHVLDRSKPEVAWTSLDPYPFVGENRPVYAIHKGKLNLGVISLLPPLIDVGIPIQLNSTDVLGALMNRANIAQLQLFDLRSEKKGIIVGASFDRSLYIAGFDPKQSGLPIWVADFLYPTSESGRDNVKAPPKPLSMQDLIAILECVDKTFQSYRYDMPSGLVAFPSYVTKYFDFREVPGLSTAYPFLGRRRMVQGYQKDRLDYKNPKAKWGIEAIAEDIYTVTNIEVPPRVAPSPRIEIPEGSVLADVALNRSGIVGEEDKVVDQLLPTAQHPQPRISLTGWLLIALNINLLIGLTIFLIGWWRKRRLNSGG